jgi:copper chaperone CopZ
MKKFLLAIAILLVPFFSFAQIKSASLTASGLTCSMCSKSIYKALTKLSSVKDVQANIETSTFTITFNEGAPVVLDEVKGAVEAAGFSVASMKVTANFPPTEIKDDAHITYGGATYHFMHVGDQTISGEKTFTVLDKKFLPDAERRKWAKYTNMQCFETGKMSPCCTKSASVASNRVYHVTL